MVPCDAVGPADVPVIQDEVDPVIPNIVASMCTNALEPIARKADRSASLPCILKKGVLPPNAG